MTERLCQIISEDRIFKNVDMKEHTTFKTGGTADVFITPNSLEELKNIVKFFYEEKIDYYTLGKGSNILIDDNGIRKPVIHIGKCLSKIDIFENCITARSGASLSSIAQKALENSLTGFEFAAGIPGTLGGAIIMNAGAYDGEMKDVIEAVSYIDIEGNERVLSCEEMEFSYRNSVLMDTNCIVTGATISLKQGDKPLIQAKMNDLAQRRRSKQPLEFPSAGSTFKRPYGHFAGKLIEEAGLRGYSIGGAQVSEKHCGFIINKGNATTNDILSLISHVQTEVYNKTLVLLEPEVKYWN